jgi:hypothetical protein
MSLAACAGEVRRDVAVGAPRTVEISVPAAARVELTLPPGEAVIEGGSGTALKAQMDVRCADAAGACADRAADMHWLIDSSDSVVKVTATPESMFAYRDSETTTHVWVPDDRVLLVNMSAGDLNIERVSGCLEVHVKAGDVSVEVPTTSVRTAWLDANFGDASLALHGDSIEGHRRMLVGAEVEWKDGPGACALSVDLGAGDIQATLY